MPSYVSEFTGAIKCFFLGVFDALKLHISLIFILSSRQVQKKVWSCLALNGFVFLGSMYLLDHIIFPAVRSILSLGSEGDDVEAVLDTVHSGFVWMYYILWTLPVYILSFFLSTVWYSEIAEAAHRIRNGEVVETNFSFERWIRAMSEEAYRLLLAMSFSIQSAIFAFIPVIGPYISFIHLCWLYSWYSFEYKWSMESWSLRRRLVYFERRWPYFIGFGFPLAVTSVAFPFWTRLGLYALLFPLFIVLAIAAKPAAHIKTDENDPSQAKYPGRLRMFKYAKKINLFILLCFRKLCNGEWCKRKAAIARSRERQLAADVDRKDS